MADQPATGVVDMIVRRVRTLIGNQRRDAQNIIGHLEISNDEMAAEFQSFGLRFDTRVIVLGNVAKNTTDLSAQQQPGSPLFDLLAPESIDWKLAGQSELYWKRIPYAENVIATNTGSGVDGQPVTSDRAWIESWEWRGGRVVLSACNQPVDLRVRGQFMPVLVANDATDPLRGAINILAFSAARSLVTTDGGPASALAKDFGARMLRALATFQSNQVKAQQLKRVRLGGRRTSGRGSGFPPPIG